ncbi:hypothetical protein CAPTEDRAFT_124162 [Capitella teleta]|uniref:Guanylate cyclase n=1 Tax=Capitella teleta TaxID=283909 RepID=R7U0U2_CAPTE|nr:hypothetical protein CAPTEDRAFT_124162 [Capitella teleta]|eukprot:ELT96795.1 hypothetical protein CAPTEDRAFT_124162 [Capitella teleta]
MASSYPWSLPQAMPAIMYAVDNIKNRSDLLVGYELRVHEGDSQCSDTYGPLVAIDMYLRRLAHVFIGPACDYAVAPVARFSPHWNIPLLTGGALVKAFKNKASFSQLTRVTGSYGKLGEFVLQLTKEFNWKVSGLVYASNEGQSGKGKSKCHFVMESIYHGLMARYQEVYPGEEVWYESFVETHATINFTAILNKASLNTRIVVLCASPDSVREIMIKAAELHFDNGEYVFFNIDLFSSKAKIERPWYRENDTEERNEKARRAYESLMTVTLRKPDSDKYKTFSEEVKSRARNQYGDSVYGDEEVNSFVGAFHDAVILYALALNETLAAGFNATNGMEVTRRMWNRTFDGITGTVSIDENGDRNADYSLLDLNPNTDSFEASVVANYFGNRKIYEPVRGKKIHWAGGRTEPPPDTPKCGFDGSGCPPDEPFPEYAIVIIVLGSLLIVVLLASFFIYRHYKLEAELAEVNWRVRWDDIMFADPPLRINLSSYQSKVSSEISRNISDIQFHASYLFSQSTLVAIKKIGTKNININKPQLMQFKKMRDLQNDHIVRFIGVCIDIPNQCLITEYCQKGSLQDVLENEQFKLDAMFKFSLMQDIVRGMAYLHSSDIKSHGKLKSSNCVVDSRFVLKITDFGLHNLRGRTELTDEDSYSYYKGKLWTCPELLRMHNPPPEGSIKGDVYSFAIICQEIVHRSGPFWVKSMTLSPQDIYRKVKNGQRPYFRPTLELDSDDAEGCSEELANMIKKCWSEEPMERPDFHSLKSIIRKINKEGDSGNILDNLLSRMEQYANNLEALVEERTANYLEQKKRAEDLLYNMLPRAVAVQLMRGESVTADSFEGVTIYFSDICGFTAMSAESTPMQVIDLLNDLYTTFDSIIGTFDVYKVETIGDAYMVVSGLPVRNGQNHAREIARMSLAILNAVMSFKIRHKPGVALRIRIGIHTGPVCAGVVGLKMPRYCLFGDTVNTASRMESNGEPLKIHVSPSTKESLEKFGTFKLLLRGDVDMKGKGKVTTYWLCGENNPDYPDLAPKDSIS